MEHVTVEQLESKIQNVEQAKEFLSNECKHHLFDEHVFNSRFFQLVLSEKKRLIPVANFENLDLKRMKFLKTFDRKNLFRIISANSEMSKFIPDQTKFSDFQRNTLLNVSIIFQFKIIKFVNPDFYADMRKSLIDAKNQLKRNVRRKTNIEISSFFKSKLVNFESQIKLPRCKTFIFKKNLSINPNNRNDVDVNVNVNQDFEQSLILDNDFSDSNTVLKRKLREYLINISSNLPQEELYFLNSSSIKDYIFDQALSVLIQEFSLEAIMNFNNQDLSRIANQTLLEIVRRELMLSV